MRLTWANKNFLHPYITAESGGVWGENALQPQDITNLRALYKTICYPEEG